MEVRTYHESMNKHLKIITHGKKGWKDTEWIAETDDKYLEQITDYSEKAEHDDAPDSYASIVRELNAGLKVLQQGGAGFAVRQ